MEMKVIVNKNFAANKKLRPELQFQIRVTLAELTQVS